MAYLHIKIGGIKEEVDPTTGQMRIRCSAHEVEPRNININLSKAPADIINRFRKLEGKVVMCPLREGMMNGQTFYKLLDDPIIELPSAPVASFVPNVAKG